MDDVSRFPDGDLGEAGGLGAVTHRSVRVWVRWPGAEAFPLRLEIEGRPPVEATVPLSAERDWTGAVDLTLSEAAPGERFTVVAGERSLHGRLTPAPDDHAGFTFAFGSCHYPYAVDEQG